MSGWLNANPGGYDLVMAYLPAFELLIKEEEALAKLKAACAGDSRLWVVLKVVMGYAYRPLRLGFILASVGFTVWLMIYLTMAIFYSEPSANGSDVLLYLIASMLMITAVVVFAYNVLDKADTISYSVGLRVPKDDVLFAYLKNIKNKACPLIEWERR